MKYQTSILDFEAVEHSPLPQTQCIQNAIDACRKAGGGEVIIPEGVWNTGSLRLYSNITLHLLGNAKLIGSGSWNDYRLYHVPTSLAYTCDPHFIKLWNLPPHYLNAIITGIQADNVAIIGEEGSEINGSDCFDPAGEEGFRGPMGIVLCKCTNVTLRGYRFADSANWSHQIDACQNVSLSKITITAGHDGFNLHHCTNVIIDSCDLKTGDDCIAGYDVNGLSVKNCRFNTSCNTFRIGGSNILVENCHFYGPGIYPHRISGRHNTLFAFEYYSHPADPVQQESFNWLIRNCTFDGLDSLIHYHFGDEIHLQTVCPLHDVTFLNVTMTGLIKVSEFTSDKERPCELRFKNASITMSEKASDDAFLSLGEGTLLTLNHTVFSGRTAKIQVPSDQCVNATESSGYQIHLVE